MYKFDKCILASNSEKKQSEGYIQEFDENIIKICLKEETQFRLFSEVTLFIFNRVKGECVYKGVIYEAIGKNVFLNNVKFIRSTQKRNNTRVDIIFRYRITHKFVDDEHIKTEKLEKPIDIAIINISANGMLIACNENFEIGHRFPFTFKDAGAPMHLDVEVVRKEKSRKANRYGCTFVNISQKDQDNIYRLVLHEQIEQRRRSILY